MIEGQYDACFTGKSGQGRQGTHNSHIIIHLDGENGIGFKPLF